MPVSTRKQLRDSVLDTTKQVESQIGTLINDYINLTMNEISEPSWAYDRRFGGNGGNYNHLWKWLKRKTSFATVSGTGDYVMERDVNRIAFMRQTSSPVKLTQITDEQFFDAIPDPTDSGNPTIYRMWEIDGLSTRLAAADTLNLVSSSASDGSSFTVTILGYVSGRLVSEVYTMNGTSSVSGTTTFDAREIFVSKSGKTTGNITVTRNTGGATVLVLAPEDISPRFKIVTLYPTPGSAMTVYVEYYKYIRELANDSDVPEFHSQYHYVVRLGTLAKVYEYLGKVADKESTLAQYASAVRSMIAADLVEPDYIDQLSRRYDKSQIILKRASGTIS